MLSCRDMSLVKIDSQTINKLRPFLGRAGDHVQALCHIEVTFYSLSLDSELAAGYPE